MIGDAPRAGARGRTGTPGRRSRSSSAASRVFDARRAAAGRRASTSASARARSSACSACSAPAASRRRWRSTAPGPAGARARSSSTARAAAIGGPDAAVALGLGLMAQDRRDCLIGEQSVADNIGSPASAASRGTASLDVAAGRRRARDQVEALEHQGAVDRRRGRARSPAATSRRCRSRAGWPPRARILIMIDPTRGVDVGARREIKRIWSELGRARPRHPARLDRRRGAGRHLRPGRGDARTAVASASWRAASFPSGPC